MFGTISRATKERANSLIACRSGVVHGSPGTSGFGWWSIRFPGSLFGESVALGWRWLQKRTVTLLELCDDLGEGKVVVPAAVMKVFHVLVAFAVEGV